MQWYLSGYLIAQKAWHEIIAGFDLEVQCCYCSSCTVFSTVPNLSSIIPLYYPLSALSTYHPLSEYGLLFTLDPFARSFPRVMIL